MKKQNRADFPGVAVSGRLSRSAEILTLKKMKYFLAVADTGQITAAAHEIHISPAVITTAIRQMEDFLSVQLFVRDRYGMHLTIDGARFRNYCEKTLSLVRDAAWALKKTSHLTGERFGDFHDATLASALGGHEQSGGSSASVFSTLRPASAESGLDTAIRHIILAKKCQ